MVQSSGSSPGVPPRIGAPAPGQYSPKVTPGEEAHHWASGGGLSGNQPRSRSGILPVFIVQNIYGLIRLLCKFASMTSNNEFLSAYHTICYAWPACCIYSYRDGVTAPTNWPVARPRKTDSRAEEFYVPHQAAKWR